MFPSDPKEMVEYINTLAEDFPIGCMVRRRGNTLVWRVYMTATLVWFRCLDHCRCEDYATRDELERLTDEEQTIHELAYPEE